MLVGRVIGHDRDHHPDRQSARQELLPHAMGLAEVALREGRIVIEEVEPVDPLRSEVPHDGVVSAGKAGVLRERHEPALLGKAVGERLEGLADLGARMVVDENQAIDRG